MNIKHWQGYGQVKAVKKGSVKIIKNDGTYRGGFGETLNVLTITVSGNHEWGIERDDTYDVYNWLLKKFDKFVTDSRCIVGLKLTPYDVNGVDHCDYTIVYRKEAV